MGDNEIFFTTLPNLTSFCYLGMTYTEDQNDSINVIRIVVVRKSLSKYLNRKKRKFNGRRVLSFTFSYTFHLVQKMNGENGLKNAYYKFRQN